MKKIIYTGIIIIFSISFSCNDDEYLNLTPLDRVSELDFWTTTNDLELYVNRFYHSLIYSKYGEWSHGGMLHDDNNSDNMHSSVPDELFSGLATVLTGNGRWNYSIIREINIMLDKYDEIDIPDSQKDPYFGEAFWFRAYYYYQLVKSYGDVPWIAKTLNTDSEELFAPRSPRNEVIDNILADLDKAIEMLPTRDANTGNRVNKEVALLLKSRIALYEGTWEKYHNGSIFGVSGSNGENYLQTAAEAAKALIDMNSVNLYSTGNAESDYREIFNSNDLSSVTEALLWKKYDYGLGLTHEFQYRCFRLPHNTGLTKSLIDDYLCIDGKPISSSSLYEGDHSLLDVVTNRDPRLRQMIIVPGDVMHMVGSQVTETFETWFGGRTWIYESEQLMCTTGYQLKKGGDPESAYWDNPICITAQVYFRYAEALLNYAEAKAELGTITQADIDLSINKIRSRAGMPDLQISSIEEDPDWDFPELSPVINEIRRERRVEYACEGFRFDDLARWRAHELIVGKRPKGAWFDQSLYPELVIGESVYVDEEGYIDHLQKTIPNGWQFNPNRDYLLPVPEDQITLNSNLSQNPGWE
jgi:starch-binding outer membrane protein, SusD/RagB family